MLGWNWSLGTSLCSPQSQIEESSPLSYIKMVSIHQAATSVTQSARAQWDNMSRSNSDQRLPLTTAGFKDSLDSLIRTMFAPCAGEIGGVPRDELGERPSVSSSKSQPSLSRGQNATSALQTAVPFEVAACSFSDESRSSKPASLTQTAEPPQFQKESLSKLRQLGAQHQLASGVHGESLADLARPCSTEKKIEETSDLIDFDDGISAISSHTLEEMERRRIQSGGVITDALKSKMRLQARHIVQEDIPWTQKESVEFRPFTPTEHAFPKPVAMTRNTSTNTRQTNATEESFQNFMQSEAKYWNEELKQEERSRRSVRPSIEERARRLRELSRSRSRSDGTGSSVSLSFLLVHILFHTCSLSAFAIAFSQNPSARYYRRLPLATHTTLSPSFLPIYSGQEERHQRASPSYRGVLTTATHLQLWIMEKYEDLMHFVFARFCAVLI